MKYIRKGATPWALRLWFEGQPCDEEGKRINVSFDDASFPKAEVKQSLLEEQGGLCCYTGIGINDDNSHIEHLKPQELCEQYEEVDYNNLLAAYPGDDHSVFPYQSDRRRRDTYGAVAKANWYDVELLTR